MQYKSLNIGNNLRESITYSDKTLPLSICIDHFDEYLGREWATHWHEEFEFVFVLKGCVQFTIYDGTAVLPTKELQEGDGLFISAGALHSAKALVPETVSVGIVFPMTFFDMKPFENFYTQNIRPIIDSGITHCILNKENEHHKELLSTIHELGTLDEGEVGYDLHCVELVCRIWRMTTVAVFAENKAPEADLRNLLQGQRVRTIMAYIHSHYSEHIGIDDMANAANISRTECFRCFRAILNKTPVEYLLEYRLSMAAVFLANTDLSLIDISMSCGFNNPSYFGKMFRLQCGLSPKKYRDQAQKSAK